MKHATVEILLFIGGMYSYGIKNAIGKWLVAGTWALFKKWLIHTERDLIIWEKTRRTRRSASVHD